MGVLHHAGVRMIPTIDIVSYGVTCCHVDLLGEFTACLDNVGGPCMEGPDLGNLVHSAC